VQTIGETSNFAIEWDPIQTAQRVKYVRFCLWAAGERIGDFDQAVPLVTVISFLKSFLEHSNERRMKALDGRSKEFVFSKLFDSVMHTVLPSGSLENDIKNLSGQHQYDPLTANFRNVFHIDDVGGPAFLDRVNVILFRDVLMQADRLVWRDLNTMKISEVLLSPNSFDEISKKFLVAAQSTINRNRR
jgi:Immunity protein 42